MWRSSWRRWSDRGCSRRRWRRWWTQNDARTIISRRAAVEVVSCVEHAPGSQILARGELKVVLEPQQNVGICFILPLCYISDVFVEYALPRSVCI